MKEMCPFVNLSFTEADYNIQIATTIVSYINNKIIHEFCPLNDQHLMAARWKSGQDASINHHLDRTLKRNCVVDGDKEEEDYYDDESSDNEDTEEDELLRNTDISNNVIDDDNNKCGNSDKSSTHDNDVCFKCCTMWTMS